MENKPIEYKYLNMDSRSFYSNQRELIKSVGSGDLIRAIPALPEHNQVLYAAGHKSFTEVEAVLACRKLCGLLPHNKPLNADKLVN